MAEQPSMEAYERACRAYVEAKADRDRYRAALEEIAERVGPPYPDWVFAGRAEDRERHIRRVAWEALDA